MPMDASRVIADAAANVKAALIAGGQAEAEATIAADGIASNIITPIVEALLDEITTFAETSSGETIE